MKLGWEPRRLGSAVTLVMGQAPAGSDCNRDGIGTPFVKVGEFGLERPVVREWTTDPKKMARKTDVLICVVGATCGKINLGADCAIGRSVAAIRPKVGIIDQRFLWYFMQGKVDEMRQGSQGAAQTVINREMINELLIPLPPIDEQRRIVAVLDKAFAGIATATANAQKNLTNARALFEAHLGEVFSSQNSEWRDTKIGEISDVSYGFTEKASFAPVGPKFLRITDIQDGEVSWENVPSCPISPKDYQRQKLEDGDIVFARTGATTGKSFLVRFPPDAVAASYLIRLRVVKPDVLPEFVQLFFQTPQYWAAVSAGTSGSAQGGFNASKLADMRLPVPPFEEQRKATEKLKIANVQRLELQKVYDKKLQALNQLKQSFLQKAFAGELD